MDQSKNYKKNYTVSDHGALNGEGFIKIGPVVSEHGLVCFYGGLYGSGPIWSDWSTQSEPSAKKTKKAPIPVFCFRMVKELLKSVQFNTKYLQIGIPIGIGVPALVLCNIDILL